MCTISLSIFGLNAKVYLKLFEYYAESMGYCLGFSELEISSNRIVILVLVLLMQLAQEETTELEWKRFEIGLIFKTEAGTLHCCKSLICKLS